MSRAPVSEGSTYSLERCSLDEISRAVAASYLQRGTDTVAISRLENSRLEKSDDGVVETAHAILERIATTRDEQLLRVHWRVVVDGGASRAHVEWFSIQRHGWHWVAERAIAAGTVIVEDDVQRVHGPVRNLDRISSETWPGNVLAVAPLAVGDAINADVTGPVPDRYAGDNAYLQIQRGPIQLQLAGVLQEAAFIKKTAKLKLHHSGAVVYGLLQANNIVVPCDSGVLSGRNTCAD